VDSATGSSLLAGIESGDRIAAVNHIPVTDAASLDAALAAVGDAATVALLVVRGTAPLYVAVPRLRPRGEPAAATRP
jgi:membrane-associated protease RseP (regulator of RpoE activity)